MHAGARLEQIKALSAKDQELLIAKIEETADSIAQRYRGCSQWALYALQQHLDMWNMDVFRAASGFAGGLGGSGELCGALSGGLIAIGFVYGRDALEPIETSGAFANSMERCAQLCDRFKEEFGGLNCRDVQKLLFGRSWDMRNIEEKEDFLNREDVDKCSYIVIKKVARLAAEIIFQP
jgi:C_GCAxxG_C_C family probable redox protein